MNAFVPNVIYVGGFSPVGDNVAALTPAQIAAQAKVDAAAAAAAQAKAADDVKTSDLLATVAENEARQAQAQFDAAAAAQKIATLQAAAALPPPPVSSVPSAATIQAATTPVPSATTAPAPVITPATLSVMERNIILGGLALGAGVTLFVIIRKRRKG